MMLKLSSGNNNMTDNHIIKAPEVDIEADKMHPMVVAAMRGGGLDTQSLRELLELQREWQRDNARSSYTRAMVELKNNLPAVLDRDRKVSYGKTNFRFTTLSHAMEAVTPHLNDYGFSLTWIPTNSEGMIRVTCRLTHVDGHYEETAMSAPPDNSGSKNPIQAIGSTQSYLQRYTALALLGIATKDMPDADDPPEPADDIVDAERNLNAVSHLRKRGISVREAEDHLKKSVKEWTIKDLPILWAWLREPTEAPSPEPTKSPVAPTSQPTPGPVSPPQEENDSKSPTLLQRVYAEAERVWGNDEWLDKLSISCEEAGFRCDRATDEQLRYIIARLKSMPPICK
jgi:hypothetical protein